MSDPNPFATPAAADAAPLPEPVERHPTITLFRRLFWGWIVITIIQVASGIIGGFSAANDVGDAPAEAYPSSGLRPESYLIVMLLIGVASIWITIRLYLLKRGANLQALLITIVTYVLLALDPIAGEPLAGWERLTEGCAEMAWGGLLALSFAQPLRARFAGLADPADGQSGV